MYIGLQYKSHIQAGILGIYNLQQFNLLFPWSYVTVGSVIEAIVVFKCWLVSNWISFLVTWSCVNFRVKDRRSSSDQKTSQVAYKSTLEDLDFYGMPDSFRLSDHSKCDGWTERRASNIRSYPYIICLANSAVQITYYNTLAKLCQWALAVISQQPLHGLLI